MPIEKAWTDKNIEDVVGNLLRIGVSIAAIVVSCGAVVYLVRHGHSLANYRVFQGEPSDLRSLHGIVRGALGLHGRAIIQMGLLILIATPVARVAFSIVGFAAEHDRMYATFTVLVLVILVFSLVGSA